jgi:hypothetical protein
MWMLRNLLGSLVIIYGGVQLFFLGVFVTQFLLSITDPVQGRAAQLWETLFVIHSIAYVIVAAAILVMATISVSTKRRGVAWERWIDLRSLALALIFPTYTHDCV